MNSRPRDDRGFVSLQVLAATMVVVIAVTAFLVSGLSDRVGCEIGGSITTVTGGPDPDCDTTTTSSASSSGDATVDLLASDNSDEDPTEQNRPDSLSDGGLTAKTFSANDSVASPAIRDRTAEKVAVATHARCALAPDRSTWESKICLIADTDNPQDAADGSELLVRCATDVTQPTNDTCNPTTDDNVRGHRTAILTAASEGETRFCQPLLAERLDPRKDNSPFRVDWACASWAENLYHCTNTLSSDTLTTARSNELGNATEPTTWVTQPNFRNLWPDTCDSRTFPAGSLACTPDKTTNLAACDIRGFQGLPLRPATCAYFHPRNGEDAHKSHTLTKPLHCRLTTTTADGEGDPATTDNPCPISRRTLKADLTVGQVACGAPQRATGKPGKTWAVSYTTLPSTPAQLAASTVEVGPFGPGGVAEPVTTTQFTFVHQVLGTAAPAADIAIPNTIFHSGHADWVNIYTPQDGQQHDVFLLPFDGTPQEVHRPFAEWLASQMGIRHTNPLYSTWIQLVVATLVAMDTGNALPITQTDLVGQLTPPQLVTLATQLVNNAVADAVPGLGATAGFAFFHQLILSHHFVSEAYVEELAEDFPGAVAAAVALLPGSAGAHGALTTSILESLAALVHLGTPLTQEAAETALHVGDPGPAQGGEPATGDFWQPGPIPGTTSNLPNGQEQVPDLPAGHIVPWDSTGFILTGTMAAARVCLTLTVRVCGTKRP